MKLGLLTAPFEDTPLMEVADWAGANGFSAFEVRLLARERRREAALLPGRPISTWTV